MAERAYAAALNLPSRRTIRVCDKITRQFWAFLVAHNMTDSHAVAPLLLIPGRSGPQFEGN